jgi:hypothetical protein
MSNYANASIIALNLATAKGGIPIVQAWAEACRLIFPGKPQAEAKKCPRGAFLGLCEAGLVRGIAPGEYLASRKSVNKDYAVRMVELIEQEPFAASDSLRLWLHAVGGVKKTENDQRKIVQALHQHNYLTIQAP